MYELSKHDPIAAGGEKIVFVHPDSDKLLIKVWKTEYFEETRKLYPLLCRFRRLPRYITLTKEIVEHIALREQNIETRYLQKFYGLVDTDLGLGMVVDAVRDRDGELAKSLNQLVEEKKFTHQNQKALDQLFSWLEENYVIVRDFSTNNVVWDDVNKHFVVIDGIGARERLSLRELSNRYNKYSMKKKIMKLKSRLEKALDASK